MEKKITFVVLIFMSLGVFAQSRFDYTVGNHRYQTVVAGTMGDTLITAEQIIHWNWFDDTNHYAPYKFEKDGKTYFAAHEYVNYIIDGDSTMVWYQNYYRQDGNKVYYLSSLDSSEEVLLVDYGLQEGDLFDSPNYGPMRVESVADIVIENLTHTRILLRSVSDPTITDEWISCIGSAKTGLLPPALVSQIQTPVLASAICYQFFHTLDLNTDVAKVIHYVPTMLDRKNWSSRDEYNKMRDEPWLCEFIGDTLHVRGYLEETATPKRNEMQVFVQGHDVYFQKRIASSFSVYGNTWHLHDLKFAGFKPGTYRLRFNHFELDYFIPYNYYQFIENIFDITAECKGNTTTTYHPFVEEGKTWKVGWIPEGETVAKRLSYYYFDGDTIVGGKNCQRMMCHDIFAKEDEITESTPEVTEYVGAFYEENRQVYGVPKGRDEFVMLYDFGANVGDMLHICGCDTASVPFWYPATIDVEVVGKGVSNTEFYKGNYTDVRLNETYRWLEGVGSTTAPVENIHYKTTDRLYRNCLMSCSVGDELIYQCGPDLVDGVSEPDLEGKKRIDFTHVVKTKPKVPARNAAESQTILLEGEFNSHVLDLNLINLHDEYTVSITSLDGEQVYTKQIRAYALLGLNIDITAYELTDYEIRVENDNEYYLATFQPVVNDIIAVSDGHASSAKGIYDLTGRRLTTEPKQGMYIRDGKKVMIK